MAVSKTTRWLDLLAFLLNRRYPVTREEIFENVSGYREDFRPDDERSRETVRRKFERDKDELRGLGIDIETLELPEGQDDLFLQGYRLRRSSFYLPYLEFVEPSAVAHRPYPGLARIPVSQRELELLDRATRRVAERTELPLARAAASARRKLQFDLPLSAGDVERVLAMPLRDEANEALAVLQRAVADRTAVTCAYYAIGRDREARRELEPYGLFFNWSRWYCVARSRERKALRVFRVDRMRDVESLKGRRGKFRVPGEFSVRKYLGRAPWNLWAGKPVTVRVRFAFPESRWVQSRDVGRVIEPLLDDGGAVLEFDVRDRNPFLRWLLTFRRHATVLEPQSLAGELEDLRSQVAALYAGAMR